MRKALEDAQKSITQPDQTTSAVCGGTEQRLAQTEAQRKQLLLQIEQDKLRIQELETYYQHQLQDRDTQASQFDAQLAALGEQYRDKVKLANSENAAQLQILQNKLDGQL